MFEKKKICPNCGTIEKLIILAMLAAFIGAGIYSERANAMMLDEIDFGELKANPNKDALFKAYLFGAVKGLALYNSYMDIYGGTVIFCSTVKQNTQITPDDAVQMFGTELAKDPVTNRQVEQMLLDGLRKRFPCN